MTAAAIQIMFSAFTIAVPLYRRGRRLEDGPTVVDRKHGRDHKHGEHKLPIHSVYSC